MYELFKVGGDFNDEIHQKIKDIMESYANIKNAGQKEYIKSLESKLTEKKILFSASPNDAKIRVWRAPD